MKTQNTSSSASELCDHPKAPNTPARAAAAFDLDPYVLSLPTVLDAKHYIRTSYEAPALSPNGYSSNTVYHADQRMPFVVTAQSRNYEFPLLLTLLARPDVVCVLDQPTTITVHGKTAAGVPFTFRYTPDFLVLTLTGVEVYEVKPADRLADLCLERPHRYQCSSDGSYRSKPVEDHFAAWGFSFHIVSERNLSKAFVQASLMLQVYVNAEPPVPFTPEELKSVHDAVNTTPGIHVRELPIENPSRRAELALHLLANARLFSHLSDSDINEPQDLRLYSDYRDEKAFSLLINSCSSAPANLEELGYQLVPGAEIALRKHRYIVEEVSPRFVLLKGTDSQVRKLGHQALLDLSPRIYAIHGAEQTLIGKLRKASQEDRLAYLWRREAIRPYLPGGRLALVSPKDRSIRRWRDAFLDNERHGLPGDLALFPRYDQCGKAEPRTDPEVLAKLDELIRTSLTRPGGGRTVSWVRNELIAAKARGEIHGKIPSERTIYRRCAAFPKHERDRKTGGKRFAIGSEPIHPGTGVMGSPHGQRNWLIAHIDSTPLDLSLTHANQDKEIIKDTLCRMTDPFDGMILASTTAAGAVNAMRIRDLIWDCWRRHHRLPRIIVVDWGSEHNNAWIQKACAFLGITLIYREKSAPRKGAPVETTFSTTNRQLVHNLNGNTKLLKNPRQITKSMDLKALTTWSSEDLKLLLEDDMMLRNELPRQRKPSPQAIAEAVNQKFGAAPLPRLTNEQVRIALLPFVKGPKRIVSQRGTVRVMQKVYHSKELVDFAGMHIDLRDDPEDPNVIYAIPPRGRRTITCHLHDLTGPTADLLEDAKLIDEKTLGPDPFENVSAADLRRTEIVEAVNLAEESQKKEKSASQRKRRSRAAGPAPKADRSNLINFTLTPA